MPLRPPTLKDFGNELGIDLSAMVIPGTQVSGSVGAVGNTYFTYNVVTDYGATAYATAALAAAGTNATTAIQNAINAAAAAGGGVVYIPSGYYRITTGLTITADDVSVIGDGPTASVLVPDDVTNGGAGVIDVSGSIAATLTPTANIAFKDRSFTITASGLAVGDWVLLRDTQSFGTQADTNTEFIARVVKVTAGAPDTIYFGERVPTPVGYLTASTSRALKLTLVTGVRISQLGFQVANPGSAVSRSCAIKLQYTLNAVVDSVKVDGFVGLPGGSGGAPPLYGLRSRNICVRNSHFDRCHDTNLANTNCRAVNIDSSTHVQVVGNEFTRCGGSGIVSHQQSAHIVIGSNLMSGLMLDNTRGDTGSVDKDFGGRGIKLLWGNVFFSVTNNIIRDIAYNAIRADDCQFGAINGNTIFDCHDQPILVIGTLAAAPWTSCRQIAITGNEVHTVTSATHGIQIAKASGITVSGNAVRDLASTASSAAIEAENATEVVICGNVIDTVQYGIFLNSGAGKCLVYGNRTTATVTNSIETSLALGTSAVFGNIVSQAVNLHANDKKINDSAAVSSNWVL